MTNNPDGLSDARALKPCPFCGSENVELYRPALSNAWAVHCDNCDFKGPQGFSKAAASTAWNTRTPPASTSTAIAAGFAMVPVEPTDEQRDAGIAVDIGSVTEYPFRLSADEACAVYRAMLAAAPKAESEDEPRYLIRKGGYYYRQNAQGYTSNAAKAGRYTLAEAIKHSHPNGPDGPRDGMDYVLDTFGKAASEDGATGLVEAALDQNDKMRQELARIGNLVSDLARAMRVDQANDDGTWPGLSGCIGKLIKAALAASPTDATGAGEQGYGEGRDG